MSDRTATDAHQLREHVRAEVGRDEPLRSCPALTCNSGATSAHLHLAVMTGPYLELVLSGDKTIESRFHRVRQAPLFTAAAGDIVVFKQSGGPVSALAVLSAVQFLDVEQTPLGEIRRRFQCDLAATSDEFWAARTRARWVSLLTLSSVRELAPLRLHKRDRRAWVRYGTTCETCAYDSRHVQRPLPFDENVRAPENE